VKRIVWTELAKTDVRSMDKATAMRILYALDRLARSGAGDVKALAGGREELRLRVGEYRVFFFRTADQVIEIRRVRHRSEAYR
jgi:mRNA-degrading endonuclease RelE of RelBE toxin-antitoxin system